MDHGRLLPPLPLFLRKVFHLNGLLEGWFCKVLYLNGLSVKVLILEEIMPSSFCGEVALWLCFYFSETGKVDRRFPRVYFMR
jgi:hypothetical protein